MMRGNVILEWAWGVSQGIFVHYSPLFYNMVALKQLIPLGFINDNCQHKCIILRLCKTLTLDIGWELECNGVWGHYCTTIVIYIVILFQYQLFPRGYLCNILQYGVRWARLHQGLGIKFYKKLESLKWPFFFNLKKLKIIHQIWFFFNICIILMFFVLEKNM